MRSAISVGAVRALLRGLPRAPLLLGGVSLGGVSLAAVSVAAVSLAALPGCSSELGSNSCSGPRCEMPPSFQNTPPPMTSSMPTSENQPAPMLPMPSAMPTASTPPPNPLLEPALTAAERAALTGVEGLVKDTGGNGVRATIVNEDKVLRAYLKWKAQFYDTCDDGSAYILKTDIDGSEAVVSEGIGYGMLISVAVGDKAVFDGLWKHYEDRRNGNGVMNWRYAPCGGQTGDNGASDADLDVAMGLVLADSRWSGYTEDARNLVAAIAQNETQICGDGRIVLKPGDTWGGCGNIVNPSYFSPGYYRRFASVQTERAGHWNQFTGDTYNLLKTLQSKLNGLIPDWSNADGNLITDGREKFGYEAVRGPWRVAVDYVWSGNADARAFLEAMAANVDSRGGLEAIAATEDFADKRNSAFLGTLSLPGIVTTQAKLDAHVADWETYEKDDVWYYQATLRLLSLLVAGGFFPAEY